MATVTEGKACVPFEPSKEAISYQPFYGKYATTGEALAAKEAEQEAPATPHAKHKTTPGGTAPETGATAPNGATAPPETNTPTPQAEAPGEPATPPAASEPNLPTTGGAAPG
jgi:hypothetical protein